MLIRYLHILLYKVSLRVSFIELPIFILSSCMTSIYVLHANLLLDVWFALFSSSLWLAYLFSYRYILTNRSFYFW